MVWETSLLLKMMGFMFHNQKSIKVLLCINEKVCPLSPRGKETLQAASKRAAFPILCFLQKGKGIQAVPQSTSDKKSEGMERRKEGGRREREAAWLVSRAWSDNSLTCFSYVLCHYSKQLKGRSCDLINSKESESVSCGLDSLGPMDRAHQALSTDSPG